MIKLVVVKFLLAQLQQLSDKAMYVILYKFHRHVIYFAQ